MQERRTVANQREFIQEKCYERDRSMHCNLSSPLGINYSWDGLWFMIKTPMMMI